jgi:phenylacetate-coenzyme A ligase PaaK-like adenylate-forming protein
MGFVQDFKAELLQGAQADFEEKALELFLFQFQNNLVYQKYCGHLGKVPQQVQELSDIPFLPISFFKHHQITSTNELYASFFESSGTTGTVRSRLYYYDEPFYWHNSVRVFQRFFGSLGDCCFFFLLPNYLERSSSSLVSMANHFYQQSDISYGGFFLYEHEKLHFQLKEAIKAKKKVVLWGVTFALLDFAAAYPDDYAGMLVFETGGMKGRGKEPLCSEVHQALRHGFGVEKIYAEYGMTELFSQAYSLGNEVFLEPPTMKVLVREMEDPLKVHSIPFQRGGLNVVDLANVDTCAFIETQDIGFLQPEGFQVLGRFDNAEVRGCNLMLFH